MAYSNFSLFRIPVPAPDITLRRSSKARTLDSRAGEPLLVRRGGANKTTRANASVLDVVEIVNNLGKKR